MRAPANSKAGRSGLALLRGLLLAILLSFATQTWSQWYERHSGRAAPEDTWRKTSGRLGAMLVMTAQADAFFREWRSTPEAHAPRITATNRVKRGDEISALVFPSGCGEPGGTCSAVVDFKVLSPNGKIYGDLPGNRAWSRPAPKPGIVALSDAHLRIRIEPKDSYGRYTVLATLRELETGKTIELTTQFEVRP